MALITCPICGGMLSDTAQICPHCGYQQNTIETGIVTCPECGNQVSDHLDTCPYCGYRMITTAQNIITPIVQVKEPTIIRTGYDVMLVDYNKSKLSTCNALKNILDISYSDAREIVSKLPAYLYNDISFNDAEYIARACQNSGMRVAMYYPDNTVKYYTPVNHNIALPSLVHVQRRPIFIKIPPRKPSILQMITHSIFEPRPVPKKPRKPVHTPPVPKPSAPKPTPAEKPKPALRKNTAAKANKKPR